MKSEHRHELAENDLAKLITRGLKKIEPYQNQILLGMLVITVAVVSSVMFVRSSTTEQTQGVAELLNCETADDYLNVADSFEGTVAGRWARLRAGEEFLREGIKLSVSDRPQSTDRLEEAQEAFDKLLPDPALSSDVRIKALHGKAMTLESLGTDTEAAIGAYQELLDYLEQLDPSDPLADIAELPEPGSETELEEDGPEYRLYSEYRQFAEDRIDVLRSGRGQQFYVWFEAQNPSPEDRPLPRDFPNPFDDLFDDDPEPGSLPPPPPQTRRFTSEATAPEPPEEGTEDDRPTLTAPGGADEGAAPEESDGASTDAAPESAEESDEATDSTADPGDE